MSDSIKVAIKVRPLIKREIAEKLPIQWTVQGNSITPLDPELKKRGDGVFSFDHIFDMSQTNINLFDIMAKPIIDAAINGVNGTIFAYGQTSSGKTYSMMGSDESPGVIPLAINYIFDTIDSTFRREFLLRVSYLEIYNERVNDLLDKNRTDLKIKEDVKTRQVVVDGCKEDVCNTPEKVLEAMKSGDRNRRTGETNMNERSSRSHTIFRITIESRESNASDGAAVHVSQLNLVDLAGSERARQTGATGERFNEGRHINLSLSSLGLVIMQLSESQENPQKFINFRDSKLTRILQASLGGNAMTAIICAITPAALEETQCTLAFASRAKRIKNKPQVNEVLSDEALLKRYRKQMAKLNAELERLKSTDVEKMESELMEKERSNQILAERLELLKKSIVCGNSSSEAESFKSKAKRRRTWGGSRTLTSKSSPVLMGLPTIKELEKTPEKIKKKEKIKRRQSIFETIDFHNQTFQTEFTDFELELIESERARNEIDERFSGGSSVCEEDYFITRRGQSAGNGRNVMFRDDVSFFSGSFKSGEESRQVKTPEPPEYEDATVQAELPSPGTPKPLLRSRVSFLMEQYNALRKDHSYLEEFAKLEKQMFVDDAVKLAMAEHEKMLAASEQKCREINEKYAKLESHSSAANKRLAELEQQLAESANSFKALKRENQDLIDSLNKTKKEKPVVESQATNNEKETSSIFENASYFEEMDVSDVQSDSMLINDTQDTSLGNLTISKLDESKKSKELSNTAYSEFMKQIGEKSSDELVSVMQELINSKLSLEEDNTNLQSMLQRKAREADDIKNDIRELKSGIEKLQETIHLLTAENTDLTSKLTTEKEHAKEAQQSLQTSIAELNSTIDTITQEKTVLTTRVTDLDEQLQNSSKNLPSSIEEMRQVIEKCKETIANLTAENEELSSNLMSKIEELDRVKDAKAPPGEHECAYRELSINLSDRNKLLEVENIELSNSLMEKIEEYDSVKEELDKLKLKTSSIVTPTESAKLIEITENFESVINSKNNKSSSQTVDDLLRLSIGADTSLRQNLDKSHERGHAFAIEPLIATNGSILNGQIPKEIDDSVQTTLPSPWESNKNEQESDQSVDAWKIKAEMLQEQVNQLNILNSKLSELKVTSCTECAHLAELNENRKALKLEAKTLNRKLRELQEKFDQECADSAILRIKANEDLNLSVCDLTMNGSMMMEGNLNISFVEEKVQALHQELEALRDKHDKLSDLYKEKCNEINELYDTSSRETTPTATFIDSPRVKRSDGQLDRIQTDMDKLRNDLRVFKKHLGGFSAALQKFVSEKAIMQAEIETLRAEKASNFTDTSDLKKAQEKIAFLEIEVAKLNEEIQNSNLLAQQLEKEKISLEAEVESLKAEKVTLEQNVASSSASSISSDQEKIETLENHVTRLCEEINSSNALKRQLEDTKASLEAQVQFLQAEGGTTSETEDATIEKIKSLENEVARLGEEISKANADKEELVSAKSSLEAEVESLKVEKSSLEEKIANTKDITTEEKIKFLESQLALFGEEIRKANADKEELTSAKSFLEAEIESLKAEKSFVGEKMENDDDIAKDEKISFLENQVSLLSEEISKANADKEELMSVKTSLEAEVQSLKAEKALMEEKIENTEDIATEENIQFLKIEVARLSEEIKISNTLREEMEAVKSALESEVEFLKVQKSHEKNTTEAKEISMEEKMQHLRNEVADLKTHNAQLFSVVNVQSSLEVEEEYFAAEDDSSEESNGIADESMTQETMKYLENEVSRLNEEINNSNVVKEELVSTRSSLEAEVQSLKAEKVAFDEKVTQTDGTLAQERINLLENEVARLNVEIIHSNEVKEELESAKSSLEAEVQYLKVEKASSEAETASTERERIAHLETELLRLSNEIDGSNVLNLQVETMKSSLEAEIEALKAENKVREESITNLLESLQNLESINSTLKITLEKVTSEKDRLMEQIASISQVCDFPNNNDQDFGKIVESLSLKLKETDQELDKYLQVNEELNNRLATIQASEENLNCVKSQLEDKIEDLQKERTDNEAHLEKLRESLKRLEESNASTILRLGDVEMSLEETEKENEGLKEKLRLSLKSEEELKNAKVEITHLKAKITSLEENLDDVRSTETELGKAGTEKGDNSEKEIDEASYETLKEYEKMVEELKSKVKDITNDLQTNAKETVELNDELTKLNSAKNELNDARLALELEVTSLKSERDDLEVTLIDLRKTVNELGEKNSSLNQELQMLRTEKQKCNDMVIENPENPSLEDYEKTINNLNSRVKEITAEMNKFAAENGELNLLVANLRETLEQANIEEQKLVGYGKCSKCTELSSDKYFEELESARTSITQEIKALKPTTINDEFAEKSISELFALFVHTIMSKEQEIIKALSDRFESEKRKLEEKNRQSCDEEKRATIWAKELEAEVERAQQDLIRQESKTSEYTNEIAKLENLLKESAHENQLFKEKMQVLELDFNTLQAELEKHPEAKHNVTLNSTQDKERLIQEALQTREMELSAKLRLVEKQSKEKVQELTKSLEFYKTKNLELTNNLEGLDANERQLKSIVDMKSNELIKANNTIENLRRELEVLTENYNQLTQQHTDATRQIDEITMVLKTKCDKLSEYKTKLETITPEYEHLKDQASERQLKLEKYKSEIECMTTENEKQISSLKDCLDSAEIKSAGYRKQVADLTNRNTVLQAELTELQTKLEELERTNAKLTKSMRNSTSKSRAAEEMEDLMDQNRTLQRNLDGASNRIADLQEMKTQMLKEAVELQGKYEAVINENTELKGSLSSLKTTVNQATELQTKYEKLLQDKNRTALELEDKKATLLQLENKHKNCGKEIEALKTTNKELDEEMDDMVKKIEELRSENFGLLDKLYKIEDAGSSGDTKESKDQINKLQTEIEDLKSQRDQSRNELSQLQNEHKQCAVEIDALKTTNKELDEEMDDMVKKIEELNSENFGLLDKLYKIEDGVPLGDSKELTDRIEKMQIEIECLRSQRDQVRVELESATKTLESFRNENSELRIKVGHLDRGDSLSCDSSRSASPALESVRVDSRRRRSRTELFNQKRQLEIFETNETNCCGQCRCATLQEEVCKLERELVTKNGQIATLEIRIQSENFPHMKRSKDLEELYASSRRKCKLLEAELQKIREMKLSELSSECDKCRHWKANKRDQSTQCLPESEKIYLSGMSSGIVEDHIRDSKIVQLQKLQKTNDRLKELCRGRNKLVNELQSRIKELEKQLNTSSNEDEKSVPTRASPLGASSKLDYAVNTRQAMKENVPTIWANQRPATQLRREWFT